MVQAFGVLQLVRFPTMDPQELCEAAKHPVVVGDPKCQVKPLPDVTLVVCYMMLYEAEKYGAYPVCRTHVRNPLLVHA